MGRGRGRPRQTFHLAALFQFYEHQASDFFQGFEDAGALERDGLDYRLVFLLQFLLELVDWEYVRQVALVELQDVRNLLEVVAVFLKVGHEIVHGLEIGVHALFLRVSDEDDAINAAQNELAAGIVKNLSRNGVEVHAGFEAAHGAEIEGKEIEEQGSLSLSGERDHLAFLLLGGLLIDVLQVGGLATKPGAVIHDFAVNLAGCEVYETQTFPQDSPPTIPRAGMSGANLQ